jgi:hypothetical protein
MQKQSTPFGVTSYENPENEEDVVEFFICKPAAIMVTAELQKDFKDVNLDSLA